MTQKKPFLLERIIEASARNPFLVIILSVFGVAGGIWALTRTPLDAIPDQSDVQVIIYTENLSENAQASLRSMRWIMAILIQASLVRGLIS